MTPDTKYIIVMVMNFLTSALSVLIKMGLAFYLILLLVNPVSEGRDFLKIIAIAVVLISVEQRIRR